MAVLIPLVALLVAPSATGSLSVFEPHPHVFVFTNPASPRLNDTVAIDVHTYLGGRLVEAGELPSIGLVQYGKEKAVEGFARVGAGHYRTHIDLWTLNPVSFGEAGTGSGMLTVWGNVSGNPFWRQLPLRYHLPGFYLRISTNITHPLPGESVAVRVEAYNGTSLIDPDSLAIRLELPTLPLSSLELATSREDLGIYAANFTLPAFDVDPVLGIALRRPYVKASATYQEVAFEVRADFQFSRYQVWFHRTPWFGDNMRGEFWVADARGQPAAGVQIRFRRAVGGWLEASTLPSGRVPVEFGLTREKLPLSGRVGEGTPMMNFFDPPTGGSASNGAVTPLDPPIMPDGSLRDLLPIDTTVTRKFRIHNRTLYGPGELLAGEEVSYYVWTGHYVVDAGRLTTDANGEVSLSFDVPQEDVRVGFMFSLDFDGERHEHFLGSVDYTVASPAVGLSVSPLVLGAPTIVRGMPVGEFVDLIDQHPALFHHVSVSMLAPPAGESWEQWDHTADALHTTENGYTHAFHLPAFLPEDANYLVRASFFTGSEQLSQFAVLRPGEDVDIPVGAMDPRVPPARPALEPLDWFPIVGIGVAVPASIVLVVVLWFRRRTP